MKKIILLCLIFITCYYSNAQKAIDVLIKQNSSDAELVKRLKSFKSVGAEKSFDLTNHSIDEMISTAKKYLGVPYKFGGTSRSGIDCSGFIVKTMGDMGLYAPHNAEELARYGTIILDKSELRPGDLIFFTKTYNTSRLVSHAAFVIEDGKMLHASSRGVNITSINNPYYYDKYYLFGTRIFGGGKATSDPVLADVSTSDKTDKPDKNTSKSLRVAFKGNAIAGISRLKLKGKYKSKKKLKSKLYPIVHPTYPIGTILKVSNAENWSSINVWVMSNKKESGKVKIGLDKKGAKKLGIKKKESVKLDFEVLKVGT